MQPKVTLRRSVATFKEVPSIHLVRVTRIRKYRPTRTYYYLRCGYRYAVFDYPLGRMDRGTPEHIVRFWLEDSAALPEVFKKCYTLRFPDVLELYQAILTGGSWGKWEWVALSDLSQEWKCKVVMGNPIKIIIPEDLQQEKTYKKRAQDFIDKVMADKLADKLLFGNKAPYYHPIPNSKK
jgi:hypothetical protein